MLGWNTDYWRPQLGACGKNVLIAHNVMINCPEKVFLGDNVRIDPFTLITTGLTAGNFIHICAGAVLGGGSRHTISLGNWCWIGYGSKLFCASEDYGGDGGPVMEFWNPDAIVPRGDIEFKDYSGVASDVIVGPGAKLPIGTAIGMRSIVWRNSFDRDECPGWSVWWGNPVQIRKRRNQKKIIEVSEKCKLRLSLEQRQG